MLSYLDNRSAKLTPSLRVDNFHSMNYHQYIARYLISLPPPACAAIIHALVPYAYPTTSHISRSHAPQITSGA